MSAAGSGEADTADTPHTAKTSNVPTHARAYRKLWRPRPRATGDARGACTARLSVDAFPEGAAQTDADGRYELVMPIERFPPSAGAPQAVLTVEAPNGASQQQPVQIRPRATIDVAEFVFP